MNRFDRDRFDQMGKEALSRVEELMNSSRINELLHKREEDEKKKNCILWVLAIIGAVAAVAGIAYAVYRFFTIWKILKMISMMILTMTSLRMRSLRKRRQKRLNSRGCLRPS
jgi:Flp pilus assembly protein TadB